MERRIRRLDDLDDAATDGARGLASTLTRNLEDVAFDSFGVDSKGEVRVVMREGEISVDVS